VSAPSLLQRLGLAAGAPDRRLAWAVLALGVAFYALGYAAFYPRGATVDDEDEYIEQTMLWLETGSFRVERVNPVTGQVVSFVPGTYPIGMIVLMAPFSAAFGPNGAFVASFLCFLVALGVTARWLADEGRSPLFAAILLAFPASAVAGRLAMSDTARAALAALGLWLFFRGLDAQRRRWWLASGLVAGLALTLRESAVLPFIPLFAGTLVRRDRGWGWLLLGGALGTAIHGVTSQLAFDNALFVRGSAGLYPFDVATLHERLPLYLIGLLVLVPGGLWFGLRYGGRRQPEIVLTIVLYFLFYTFQAYGMSASSFAKRLVIGLRYFDPLLPLLAFAMAESAPRVLSGLLARLPGRLRAERWAGAAVALWLAGVTAAAFALHPALDRWGASQAEIRDTLERMVPRDAVLVTNGAAIRKFIDDLERPYTTLHRNSVSPERFEQLREKHGGFVVAFLDRSDSAYWREDAAQNAAFATQLDAATLLVDVHVTPTDRLRIWRVGEPRKIPQ